MPKFSNLSGIEKRFLEYSRGKRGERHAVLLQSRMFSTDSKNAQFLRYLRATVDKPQFSESLVLNGKNPYHVTDGLFKQNGEQITIQEAINFNKRVPDFFSEQYFERQKRQLFISGLLGFKVSLLVLWTLLKRH